MANHDDVRGDTLQTALKGLSALIGTADRSPTHPDAEPGAPATDQGRIDPQEGEETTQAVGVVPAPSPAPHAAPGSERLAA